VTSSLHLGKYGILHHEFIRSHYVLAGLWFWMPIAAAAGIRVMLRKDIDSARDSAAAKQGFFRRLRRRLGLTWTIIGTLAFATIPITWMSLLPRARPRIEPGGLVIAGVVLLMLVAGLFLCACTFVFLEAVISLTRKQLDVAEADRLELRRWDSAVSSGIFTCGIAVLYTAAFTSLAYPQIPAAWGGGQAIAVKLHLPVLIADIVMAPRLTGGEETGPASPDNVERILQEVVTTAVDNQRAGQYADYIDLIHEDDTRLAILRPRSKSCVWIRKADVTAVEVLTR
jgi:hypothetical protein